MLYIRVYHLDWGMTTSYQMQEDDISDIKLTCIFDSNGTSFLFTGT